MWATDTWSNKKGRITKIREEQFTDGWDYIPLKSLEMRKHRTLENVVAFLYTSSRDILDHEHFLDYHEQLLDLREKRRCFWIFCMSQKLQKERSWKKLPRLFAEILQCNLSKTVIRAIVVKV